MPSSPPSSMLRFDAGGMEARWLVPRSLEGLVVAIVEQRALAPMRWRFLPDGCVTLMLRIGGSSGLRLFNDCRPQAVSGALDRFCFVAGLATRPVDVTFDRFHYFGAILSPVAVRGLLGVSASELRDRAVEGELIVDGLDALEDRLNELPTFDARARYLERELHARLRRHDDPPHLARGVAMRAASLVAGRGSSRPLHERLGYSRAQTHRIFKDWLGLSPGAFQRLHRFVRGLEALHAPRSTGAAAAQHGGFVDQAHFIRTFRSFAGMTPGEYVRRRTDLVGQLPAEG